MNATAESGDNGAVYNIGTASRKSGLSVTTIRTWEDRYGAVVPTRDHSGRRLYSDDQINQLTWLRQQIDAGLRASEAHRLLVAGDADPGGLGGISDLGTASATFMAWVDQETSWIGSVLDDLARGLRAEAAALGTVVPNSVAGPILTIIERHPRVTGDDPLAPMAALVMARIEGLTDTLGDRETFVADGSLFGVVFERVAITSIRFSGVMTGALIVCGNLTAGSEALASRAGSVIESRIEADRARSAFTSLLG